LEKPSLNQIEASWDPTSKSEKAEIRIQQTAYTEEHPTLRPHRIKIGLFKEDKTIDVIETLIEPKT
jgi:aminopeptidase N